jgi:hypothetical protein
MRGVIAEGIVFQRGTTVSSGYAIGGTATVSGGSSASAFDTRHHKGVSHSEGIGMTSLVARVKAIMTGIEAHNRKLMPPEPPYADYPFDGEKPRAFYNWMSELHFRNTLVTKNLNRKAEDMYYCSRCAGVFVVGNDEFVPLDQLEEFFYRYPSGNMEDFCEIHGAAWRVQGLLRPQLQPRMLLALAYGTNGIYTVQEVQWTEKAVESSEIHKPSQIIDRDFQNRKLYLPAPSCPKCTNHFQGLLSKLQAAGWKKLSEQGKYWYQARFVLTHSSSSRD